MLHHLKWTESQIAGCYYCAFVSHFGDTDHTVALFDKDFISEFDHHISIYFKCFSITDYVAKWIFAIIIILCALWVWFWVWSLVALTFAWIYCFLQAWLVTHSCIVNVKLVLLPDSPMKKSNNNRFYWFSIDWLSTPNHSSVQL